MEEGAENGPLKLYFLPFLAAGHMIPLCDIATQFASRGQHVTIITTPSNAKTLLNRKSNNHLFHQYFNIHTIDIPSDSVQIENVTFATDLDSFKSVYFSAMLLRQPVEQFLRENPPDVIVADYTYHWVYEIANTLQIPSLAFNGLSLFNICAMKSFSAHQNLLSGSSSNSFVLPDLPHVITMHVKPPETIRFFEANLEGEMRSHGLIMNSFVELESEYVEHYERTTGHKAWLLGPVSLVHTSNQEKAERGHVSVVSENDCVSWLNTKEPNSVVYISFGSVCRFPENQLYEIAYGVEASGHQFIWVVPEEKEKGRPSGWLLPEGFEERMKEKGMIIRGWAPQVLILNHHAIGGFVTHCGWNSVIEAISAGVPMITWPVCGDAFYNEKLITEVQRNGVEVGVEEWLETVYEEGKTLVSREKIEKAVRRVMDTGDEIRQRAHQLGVKAKEAVREGGSSHLNLTSLIRELKLLRKSH